MDGRTVEIANWMAEPPGIFMGRGKHPLRGRWKSRINSENLTLNLGIGDMELDMLEDLEKQETSGRRCSQVVSDHHSMWVARWIDKLTGNEKYVWLSEGSHLRQMREKAKFDKAVSLEKKISRVREYIENGMNSKDEATRKVATACYLIDRLAMRVGDEKDTDEADTVGASTLRCEHLKLGSDTMEFDFLGKDSVRWEKTINVRDEADRLAYANLQSFLRKKEGCNLVFDGIGSVKVNRFLGKTAQGLTAKVFRTYLATNIVRDYLQNNCHPNDDSDFSKIYCARMANLQAAIACNHKKTPPKNWEESLRKKEERLNELSHQESKTEKARERHKDRLEKLEKTIKLTKITRDYNLNTSLKNYIDPRVFKTWSSKVKLDWRTLYSKTLQKKFEWVERARSGMPEIESDS
jgi:DNA topoisomerase-1